MCSLPPLSAGLSIIAHAASVCKCSSILHNNTTFMYNMQYKIYSLFCLSCTKPGRTVCPPGSVCGFCLWVLPVISVRCRTPPRASAVSQAPPHGCGYHSSTSWSSSQTPIDTLPSLFTSKPGPFRLEPCQCETRYPPFSK